MEDYNLWVAFMETETPPGSPSPASMAASSGQDMGKGERSGNNEDGELGYVSSTKHIFCVYILVHTYTKV